VLNAPADNGGPAAAGPVGASPEELIERVERLTTELERVSDPIARERAEELVAAVIEVYGQGLERILALIDDDESSAGLRERLAADGIVASLMLIHGLYPVGINERVVEALDSVRPYMESHGGDVELLGIEDGVARIRLEGSCDGCPASSSTLELAIKSALDEAAPDLEGLVVEGAVAPPQPATPGPGSLELPVVQVAPGAGAEPPTWFALEAADELADGELTTSAVNGVELIVARVEGSALAFLDRCAGCGGPLGSAELSDGTLVCPECERRFFLPRAGRSLDDDGLLLEPVPLLASAGRSRVALPAAAAPAAR
jgi:Fe-S cluster biogenesis protein NfuA/nitrite reductase/ring-hydroxylating ferredoxin subunit